MPELQRPRRVQLAVLVGIAVAVAAVWFNRSLAVGILPAIWVALWIPVVAWRREKTIEGGGLWAIFVTLAVVVAILIALWSALR